jgi:hypothetical protein
MERNRAQKLGSIALSAGLLLVPSVVAQMTVGNKMPGYAEAFGLDSPQGSKDFTVQELSIQTQSGSIANVLLPGENARLVFHIVNKSQGELKASGFIHVIHYGTSVPAGEFWVPHVFKIDNAGDLPISVDVPRGGSQDMDLTVGLPGKFGGYAMIMDLGEHGKYFAATLVRVIPPDTRPCAVSYVCAR